MLDFGFFVFAGTGLLFMAVGVPFAKGLVPPNYWAGFRVPKTLKNRHIWYAANRVMGRDFIYAGAALFVLALILAFTVSDFERVARLHTGATMLALGALVVHSFWALRRM